VGIQDDLKRLEIRNERLHRLRLLELAQARKGGDTPPDIIIEIETTKAELGMSDLLLAEKASIEFADMIGSGGQFLVLARLIGQLAKQVDSQGTLNKEQMDAQRDQIESRIEAQGRATEARIDRVEDMQLATNDAQDLARAVGQRRTRLAMFSIAITLVVLAVLVLFIVVALRRHGF